MTNTRTHLTDALDRAMTTPAENEDWKKAYRSWHLNRYGVAWHDDGEAIWSEGCVGFAAGYLAHAETVERLTKALIESEAALTICRQSLAEQAMARADPTMPRLSPEVLEAIRADAEANYAMAETREDRINAHGLSLLCNWQERQALADLQPKETK